MADAPNPTDPFEFFRRFWAPMGMNMPGATGAPGMPGAGPIPGFPPGMVFPTTSTEELDKRVAELRAVEGWLNLNLEMVRATIQGFEAQKATLEAYRSMNETMSQAAGAAAASGERSRGGRGRNPR
jgi:hypothetical protein